MRKKIVFLNINNQKITIKQLGFIFLCIGFLGFIISKKSGSFHQASREQWTPLSVKEQSLQAAINQALYAISPIGHADVNVYRAVNPAQKYQIGFDTDKVKVFQPTKDKEYQLHWELKQWGYQGRLRTVSSAQPLLNGNRVEYLREGLTEWYVNDASGLEQGFTLHEKPIQSQANIDQENWLEMVMDWTGHLTPKLSEDHQSVLFQDAKGETMIKYEGLYAYDATGQKLASKMALKDSRLILQVNDQNAQYPVTIDPKLTGTCDKGDLFGWSVDINGDYAVVGAPFAGWGWATVPSFHTEVGLAFVFIYNNGSWIQSQVLAANDGKDGDHFGWSVAISSNTIIVGVNQDFDVQQQTNPPGKVYIFTLNNNTWVQKQILKPSDSKPFDGFGLAVDIDENTAIIGAPSDVYAGVNPSAYIFRCQNNVWVEKQKVTCPNNKEPFGSAVAVDDYIVLVGAECDHYITQWNPMIQEWENLPIGPGAVYVFAPQIFVNPQSWWLEKILIPQGAITNSGGFSTRFAASVDIKKTDTNLYRVVVGAPDNTSTLINDLNPGSAFVFERTNPSAQPWFGSWKETQQIAASDGELKAEFGYSVAISQNRILIGAPRKDNTINNLIYPNGGAAYSFAYNKSTAQWVFFDKYYEKNDPATSDQWGNDVALDGYNGIMGIYSDDVWHQQVLHQHQGSVAIQNMAVKFQPVTNIMVSPQQP